MFGWWGWGGGVGGRTSTYGMAKDEKILAFLELFIESQNHREKLIYDAEIGFIEQITS